MISRANSNPAVIGHQVERMRRKDSTEAYVVHIDRMFADVDRQRQKFVSHLSRLDAEASELVYVRLDELGITSRKLAAERTVILDCRHGWEATQSKLDQPAVWCETVAANLAT